MYTFLAMTQGARVGTNFLLNAKGETSIGRDIDCDIVLTDPLCSRVHAIVLKNDEGWFVEDAESRNGVFVNGQKIKDAQLLDGCVLKMGGTEFTLRMSSDKPSSLHKPDLNLTQTFVRESPVDPHDTGHVDISTLKESENAHNLLVLHQLTISLLGARDPDEVVEKCLDLLLTNTRASVVGFLWVTDEGELRPKQVIPQDHAGKVSLSETLTEKVSRQRHAVWVANTMGGTDAQSLQHFADAICIPLLKEDVTVGAVHLYREREQFRQDAFDFAIRLANIMAVALVRAREEALLSVEHRRLVDKSAGTDELIGESEPMQKLKSMIGRVAKASGCVLVRGESGSGKELVARALHRSSSRADRPMLSVNCAAIPRELIESQLFGHKKGAFTGADSDHAGWFQQADSGTLFLDEVGELTLDGQAKLLRILEGHPFLPVGSTKEVSVDVRVIAATNRDLQEFVAEKRFREDLFYRLSVFELYIPPLRDRGSDIERLINHFLQHFKGQHGRPNLEPTKEAMGRLLSYNWPGNVRQLRNVIDSAVVMAEGDVIESDDLGLRDTGARGELDTLRIDHWERKLIKEALKRTSGSVPQASKLLGIARATLYRKIDDYGIERK